MIPLTLIACQNKSYESKSEVNTEGLELVSIVDSIESEPEYELDIQTEPKNKTFDWSLTKTLKENLISDIENKPKEIDKSLMLFLDEYDKIIREFNEILYSLSSYDSLNTLAYAPNGVIHKNAIEFKELVNKNGFNIAHSEGMIYLTKSPEFIKSKVPEFIDSISMEFINLYCREIEKVCCEDAAIIISDKELVERAFHWGNLLEKVKKMEFKSVAENKLDRYLLLIYWGQENTPSFDWKTKEYNRNIFNLMNEIIENHPNSIAAKEFKIYSELLISENYTKTAKIEEYLKDF